MDADTLDLLGTSLRHVLLDGSDRPLGERLNGLGWDEVLEDDAPAALRLLFETRGTTLSGADALGPLLARSIAGSLGEPDLASAVVLLPRSLHPGQLSSHLDGDRLVVDGVAPEVPKDDLRAIVPVATGPGAVRLAVLEAPSVTAVALEGADPSLRLSRFSATLDAPDVGWVGGDDATAAWEAAAGTARWALGAELVAIGGHVIAQAVEYTGQRKQYGRPIGSFQALQHRLAGAYSSVIGASRAVEEASASGSAWDALVAKALAGRAAENACTQAQQSYGAIGFTWEHEFHRYLRRTYLLDWLFGDWRSLEREIGEQLLAQRSVPKIGTL
jgi:hypothetical protein